MNATAPPAAPCAGQHGTVQPVPGPQLVARAGFEPAIDLPRRTAVRADVQPWRAKCVCNVRNPGTWSPSPAVVSMISLTCAAVRSGRSRFNRNASSSIPAGVRGATTRG